jgi:ABC-type glycerol-3-phosphate transport system permease component
MSETKASHIRQPKGVSLILRYLLLAVMATLFLLPVFWMISSSLKTDYAIFARPPVWWPESPQWTNFPQALTSLPFGRFALNTTFIAVFNIIGHLLSCSVVAYGFARLNAPGKKFFFMLMLATLMLPYPVTMVPLYIIFSKFGWVNSFLPLILPAFFGHAFYIFLLRQTFRQIPIELEDAAVMDGANTLQVLWHIILPLARPALATVAIFTFQTAWNDFLAPLIFLHDQKKYTLMLGLSFFRGSYEVNWAYLMAASLTVSIPVILVFLLAQRQFIQGLAFNGSK